MKYLEYRNEMDIEYFPYLRYSAYSFLIPTSFYLYNKKYDFFIVLLILSLTSILRWTYVKSTIYQFIDHNYVKLVFLLSLYAVVISCTKCMLTSILILGSMINIALFYTVAVYYDYIQNKKNVIFHMMVHLYTTFGLCLSSNHFISYYDN